MTVRVSFTLHTRALHPTFSSGGSPSVKVEGAGLGHTKYRQHNNTYLASSYSLSDPSVDRRAVCGVNASGLAQTPPKSQKHMCRHHGLALENNEVRVSAVWLTVPSPEATTPVGVRQLEFVCKGGVAMGGGTGSLVSALVS